MGDKSEAVVTADLSHSQSIAHANSRVHHLNEWSWVQHRP